jgi:predicted HicB family RNase H-like nuclease
MPMSERTQITIRVAPHIATAVKAEAEKRYVSVNYLIEAALKTFLSEQAA